jgi:cytochrome P450
MSAVSLEGYSPMDPARQQDPFPHYAALRRTAAVYRGSGGIYFVSTHAAVLEVLQQPKLFSSQWGNSAGFPPTAGLEEEMRQIRAQGYPAISTMLTLDPPQQTRYRKSVGRAFSTRRIAGLEPEIREIVCGLLDAWPAEGPIDFLRQAAIAFPVRVIARMLSIPEERERDIKRWSDESVAAIGVKLSPERALESARQIVALQNYLASLLEDRQREPRDDFLSELVAADFEAADGTRRKLETAECISICQQLLVAGNEATTKGISEIMKLLIENPDEWEAIRRDASRIPATVEEGLRLASPNQGLFRVCTEDTELAGVAIPRGAMLWAMFGSANRDEQVFPDPDRFDPTRDNLNDSLAFGRGAHFCIGAQLARLEIRVLFEELTKRFRRVRFAPGTVLEYEPSFILRGLRALSIEVERPSPEKETRP